MQEMEQIHDTVFEFLIQKHFVEKGNNKDFYFYLRRRFPENKKNYWFLGNEFYLALTFWTGTDYQNKTPNIYLEINIEGKVILYIVGKSDDNKAKYFSKLTESLKDIEYLQGGVWRKIFTENHEWNYIPYLIKFISEDKLIIDKFLNENIQSEGKIYDDDDIIQDELDTNNPFTLPIKQHDFYEMLRNVMRRKYWTQDYHFSLPDSQKTPMYLCFKSLEVRNFRGIEKLYIDGIPVNAKWIVLTGENGYGKSSVLQSIAIGLFGNIDGSFKLLDEGGFVLLEAKRTNENFINLSTDFGSKSFNSVSEDLAVYGATRLRIGQMISGHPLGPDNVTYNLFFPDGSLIDIENELRESNAYQPLKFNLLKEAFCRLIPDLDDIVIDTSTNKPVIKYIEKDKNGNPYKELIFNNLAAGFRNIIAVVGDIITRFSRKLKNVNSLTDLRGIVIIDEIELHLHPKYQKHLPKTLSELFPNIQFIVSTHSPITLLGVPKETVLLKVNRDKETGITVERLDVDFTNLLPNAILSSPVFGFQDIIPESHHGNEIINVTDTYSEIKQDEKIKSKIEEFLSEEKTQELLKLLKK